MIEINLAIFTICVSFSFSTNKMFFFLQEFVFKSQISVLKWLELMVFMFWVTWVFNRVERTCMKVEDEVKKKRKNFEKKKEEEILVATRVERVTQYPTTYRLSTRLHETS